MAAVFYCMSDLFSYKRILVVTAHPDDEAFLAAGTIRQLVERGAEVRLVCMTQGERGRAWTSLTGSALGQVREQELRTAAALMGVRQVEVLGFADGMLATAGALLTGILGLAFEKFSPELVITFGPDGYTGHSDHCVLHQAVLGVATQSSIPMAFFTHPPEPWRKEVREVLSRKRIHGVYQTSVTEPEIAHVVPVDREQKLLALRAHQTQFPGLDPYRLFSAPCAEHFLSYEYFTFTDACKKTPVAP